MLVDIFVKQPIGLFKVFFCHWLRYGSLLLSRDDEPLFRNLKDVLNGNFLRLAVSHTSGEFWDDCNIGTVFLAPNNIHRITMLHHNLYWVIILLTCLTW